MLFASSLCPHFHDEQAAIDFSVIGDSGRLKKLETIFEDSHLPCICGCRRSIVAASKMGFPRFSRHRDKVA
jgi:hypothetical protein